MAEEQTMSPDDQKKPKRGFAAMSPTKRRAIASKGGRARGTNANKSE